MYVAQRIAPSLIYERYHSLLPGAIVNVIDFRQDVCLELPHELGHVDKWRCQERIDVMSMKPRKLSAVVS